MSAQKGRDLLLKIDVDGTGNYQTIAGIRSRNIAINGGQIDATDSASPNQWRELLSGGGIKSLSITGQGIFKDADTDALLRTYVFSGSLAACEILLPDFGSFKADFQVVALEYTGSFEREITFEIRLESGSEVLFTQAA